MITRTGDWMEIDPVEVSDQVHGTPGAAVHLSPSPYDVPIAMRVVEGDPLDPAYGIELVYITGREPTVMFNTGPGLGVEVGKSSRRIYKVNVDPVQTQFRRNVLDSVKAAIAALTQEQRVGSPSLNYAIVERAFATKQNAIIDQLARGELP